jgi:AcrR family transcriptional regulator
MRRSRTQTRQCILDAAYGLFWRQGFLRVSMDDIAARADITKRALYQRFRSKDDLIAAALVHSSELALERLRRFRRPTKCDELIDSFFTELADWAAKPRWSGGDQRGGGEQACHWCRAPSGLRPVGAQAGAARSHVDGLSRLESWGAMKCLPTAALDLQKE